jgi:adenylate cyclase
LTFSDRHVLVADDDPKARSMIVEVLKGDGHQILEADSEAHAIELAQTRPIDAFVLNIEMAPHGGLQLCRAIRSMEQYRTVPIILVANSAESAKTIEAFAAGGDDLISTALNPSALRDRLMGRLLRTEYFQQLERSQRTLNRFLSKRTLEIVELAARTGALPDPEERELAILFTDIRGFTALSEQIEPARLFELVSSVLAREVDLVHSYGGYIDKFGGDGVMAIFDGPDMVVQSCLCAQDIVRKPPEATRHLWRSSIGIHAGRAIIGNIGSPDHLDYSVIGTTVNLAARLCGHAEPLSIVVSKAVRDAATGHPALQFHSEREVAIRGFKGPVTVYTLGC